MTRSIRLTPCIPVIGTIIEDDEPTGLPLGKQFSPIVLSAGRFQLENKETDPSSTSSRLVIRPLVIVSCTLEFLKTK